MVAQLLSGTFEGIKEASKLGNTGHSNSLTEIPIRTSGRLIISLLICVEVKN